MLIFYSTLCQIVAPPTISIFICFEFYPKLSLALCFTQSLSLCGVYMSWLAFVWMCTCVIILTVFLFGLLYVSNALSLINFLSNLNLVNLVMGCCYMNNFCWFFKYLHHVMMWLHHLAGSKWCSFGDGRLNLLFLSCDNTPLLPTISSMWTLLSPSLMSDHYCCMFHLCLTQ